MNPGSTARSAFGRLPVPVQAQVLRRTGRYPPWADGQAPRAPACPPGMTVGPPDFVGVGVSKCGTSWWFNLVLAHPDIHGPIKKELLYFNRIFFERHRHTDCTDEELRAYHQWFPRPPGAKTGEWTPSYIFSYRLPPILLRAAPDAKILVLLRDPVDRYQSDISRRMPRRRLRNVRYRGLAHGYYSSILEPWEAVYPPSQISVMQFEACVRHPAEHLAATYRFLGLDDSFCPPALRQPVNPTKSKRAIDAGFRHLLVECYEPDVAALAARHPHIDLRLWPNFSYLAKG
jgi:Sulfotransferase family